MLRAVLDTNVVVSGLLKARGGATHIVTGNLRDFPKSPFQNVAILPPAEFARRFS